MRRRWHVRGAFSELLVELGFDASEAGDPEESRRLARVLVGEARRGPGGEAERAFVEIHRQLFGLMPPEWEAARRDPGQRGRLFDRLEGQLERAAATGMVRVDDQRVRSLVIPLPGAVEDALGPESADEQVADVIILAAKVTQVGDGDKPLILHPVNIIDPDTGDVVASATTDEDGVVRAEVPKEKTYRIEIGELDPDWYPAPIYDTPPEGVIHFRLVDEGGVPVANQEVKATVGDVETTFVTDDNGEVMVSSHLCPYALEVGDETFWGHAVLASEDEDARVHVFAMPGVQEESGAAEGPKNRLENWFPTDDADDDDADDDDADDDAGDSAA